LLPAPAAAIAKVWASPIFQRIGMSGSSIITGLMVFFSLTTVGVVLYPVIKLTPSWLERRLGRKIDMHRASLLSLDAALAVPGQDAVQVARLAAQRDWHRAALQSLAADTLAPTVSGPLPIDLAA
jgi:hypothetical protein